MTINQLKYFVSAAECGSFTKAAESCYITQTAMTQQIRALEDDIGCLLFDRSKRPLALTPAGQTFLNEAKAVLARLQNAVEKVSEASTGIVGALRIGYTKGYERSYLSNLLQQYHRERPNVLVSFYRKSTDELASGLLAGDYDMIFTWDSTNLRSDPRTSAIELEHSPLVVAMYPDHPLARRRSLKRSELKYEKFLYMSPSADMNSYGDAYFLQLYQEAGFTPNIVFRSTDTESILMMVASEQGISILPEFFTKKLTNADNLAFIPLEGKKEIEVIHSISLKENTSPALQYLRQLLTENLAARRTQL